MLRDIFNSELFLDFVGRELNLQEKWLKYEPFVLADPQFSPEGGGNASKTCLLTVIKRYKKKKQSHAQAHFADLPWYTSQHGSSGSDQRYPLNFDLVIDRIFPKV